jgi:hypothetical protein
MMVENAKYWTIKGEKLFNQSIFGEKNCILPWE